MDEKYWDKMAADYDGEIFSCLANDRDGIIISKIEKFGSKKAAACDFGCGVGKFLPVLSNNFKHVYAVDISEKLLEQAKETCIPFDNISCTKADLARDKLKVGKVDFALCVNVLIMPSQKIRDKIIDNIAKHVKQGGYLVLVVPSLESALFTDFRLIQWNLKEGLNYSEALEELDEYETKDLSIRQGIIEIDSVPTKHYLKEELISIFKDRYFDVLGIEKVEYGWDTEFDQPPRWMNQPYPWDWLITLQKT